MARLIQTAIKTPLADELIFGKLKHGGVVRVVVGTNDNGKRELRFVYPDGPILPRKEQVVEDADNKPKKKASNGKSKAKNTAKDLHGQDSSGTPSQAEQKPRLPVE